MRNQNLDIVVIEDEKPAARRLVRMLERAGHSVKQVLHSVAESLEWFKAGNTTDLIFLDIQLGDGLSFEIFEQIDVDAEIIFTTAYDEYALRAFKLRSIDYLLKPVDDEDLENALTQVQGKSSTMDSSIIAEIQRALQGKTSGPNYKKRWTASVGTHLKTFTTDDVSLFFSENRGTYLNTHQGRHYLIDGSMDSTWNQLDPEKFFRVSRKHIVAHSSIVDIIDYSNSRLKVKVKGYDEQEIIVSRERVKDFRAWLDS